MYKKKTFLAIIPARGGSKRIPRKNILELNGKPLIAWTIEAGLKSKYIDELIVSTDDDEITNISKKYGAKVPFKRNKEFSDDYAGKEVVIIDVLNYYKNKLNITFDYFIYLQPTSPLRDMIDIDLSIEYLFNKNADAIISVCEVEHPIQWSGTLPNNKDMSEFINNEVLQLRSQDLDKHYRLNGAIYICNVTKFKEEGSVFIKENIFAYEMDQAKSIDIDSKLDFNIAEVQLKY